MLRSRPVAPQGTHLVYSCLKCGCRARFRPPGPAVAKEAPAVPCTATASSDSRRWPGAVPLGSTRRFAGKSGEMTAASRYAGLSRKARHRLWSPSATMPCWSIMVSRAGAAAICPTRPAKSYAVGLAKALEASTTPSDSLATAMNSMPDPASKAAILEKASSVWPPAS